MSKRKARDGQLNLGFGNERIRRRCKIESCGSFVFCRGWCVKHYTRWQRYGDPMATRRRSPMAPDATEKWCPRCEMDRPVEEFRPRRGGGLDGYCWPCKKAYHNERNNGRANARRREVSRNSRRRNRWAEIERKYGITQQEYNELLEQQQGKCGICKADEPGGGMTFWNIDHDHATGRIRGLLCVRCNQGLGQFRDNPEFLINACVYLGAVPSSPIGFFKESV